MIDKDMKLAKLYVGRLKCGKRVREAFARLVLRCELAEADVEQLGKVIMNERAMAGHVGMYCLTKTKDKIVIKRNRTNRPQVSGKKRVKRSKLRKCPGRV